VWGRNENIDRLFEQYFGNCHSDEDHAKAREVFVREHGEKELEQIEIYKQGSETYLPVWLCRKHTVLGLDEYFEKEHQTRMPLQED
jgi:hypothetical protein